MKLSVSHLRYLLTIYELAQKTPDVVSLDIAQQLEVSKPSVTTALESLMKRGLVIREKYGKIYLTNRDIFTVRYYQKLIESITTDSPALCIELTAEEKETAAMAMVIALPDQNFFAQYEALFETE